MPDENIVIRDCAMKDGHGGVVLGSETSGGIRNVFVERCAMDSPHLDRALRIKSNARRGGVVENIFMRQVTIARVAEAVLTIDLLYEEGAHGDHPPVVRHVRLDDVTSTASPRVLFVRGFPGATIDRLEFADCRFQGLELPDVVDGAGTIVFRNVAVVPARPAQSLNSRPAP